MCAGRDSIHRATTESAALASPFRLAHSPRARPPVKIKIARNRWVARDQPVLADSYIRVREADPATSPRPRPRRRGGPLTSVEADEHIMECGFAALVVLCSRLNAALGFNGVDLRDEIMWALSPLVGMRLVRLGRAADVQWFAFASADEGELTLHVQCPWRLVAADEILVGQGDYWRPAAADTPETDYDRAAVGSRWRDVRRDVAVGWLGVEGAGVESAEVDAFGGFTLRCTRGLRLHVFPDATRAPHDEVEFWRLFAPGAAGQHFVVSSDGIHRVG